MADHHQSDQAWPLRLIMPLPQMTQNSPRLPPSLHHLDPPCVDAEAPVLAPNWPLLPLPLLLSLLLLVSFAPLPQIPHPQITALLLQAFHHHKVFLLLLQMLPILLLLEQQVLLLLVNVLPYFEQILLV